MKKKAVAVVLGLCMMVGLAGCGNNQTGKDIGKIELGKYIGVEITKNNTDATEEEIDYEMEQFVQGCATDEEITDGRTVVEEKDKVNINYAGKVDGIAFDGGTNDTEAGHDLVIGSNSFINGFESQLIGTNVGDTVDITVTFPENYTPNPDLAGKEAVFTVTINAILSKNIIPELTDALVAENTDSETIAEYREYLREEIKAEKEYYANRQLQTDVLQAIIDDSVISDIPDSVIAENRTEIDNRNKNEASYYGVDLATYILIVYGMTQEQYETELDAAAEYYSKQNLVIDGVIKKEKLTISDEEYTEGATRYAEQSGATVADLEEEYGKDYIKESLLTDKALNLVFDSVVIIE